MALRGTVAYVMNAVHALKEAKGATMKQIMDFIADVKGGLDKLAVRKALDQCVAKGTLKLANDKYTSGIPEITVARRRTRRGRRRRGHLTRRRRRRSRMTPEEASGRGDGMSRRRGNRRGPRRARRNSRRREEPDLQQNSQSTTGNPENGQEDGNNEVQS